MKLLLASDIHGSALYGGALAEAIEREGADRVLLLGDILYHGPRNALPEGYDPQKTAALLNGYADKILCVRGNCDAEIDEVLLAFPITEAALLENGGRVAFASHGHRYSPENLPKLAPASLFFFGHIHVPVWREVNGILCVNPGSVSIPKGDSTNGYMTWENGEFLWKDMDGNILKTWRQEK